MAPRGDRYRGESSVLHPEFNHWPHRTPRDNLVRVFNPRF